jgi:flagellar motor component MotA|tara:strand:+ start:346 stop:750 length:405 start_codon:yes stop_codon:yes gene_type:complete
MTTVEATNRELLDLFRGLEAVKTIKGARFAVLVGKNLKELRHILEPIEKAAQPTFQFQEVSVKMQELAEKEDKDGMTSLEKQNQNLIDERKAQLSAVEDMLDEKAEILLHVIKEAQLPEEITGEHIEKLIKIIQ